MSGQGQRRLVAIMFTDIVGYSTVMQEDEERGRLIRERHKNVFERCSNRYNGEIIQYFGDGTLSVFSSAVSAVECAVRMQKELKSYPPVPLRIGIHLGDIHYDETEVYGHGVNVAARLEPVCNPGGIFISGKVYDEIRNHPYLKGEPLGVYRFKNIDEDIALYAINDKDVIFPTADQVAQIKALTQKVQVSKVADKSKAIRNFTQHQKRNRVQRQARWALTGVIALLVLTLVARWSGLLHFGLPDNGQASIAVLPFENMSPDPENDYFSDGMTEDILTLLSKIDGFSVTSRTSVMHYKHSPKNAREIAEELGVENILEGSVRRDGDRVRISAQLIDAKKDAHIWAHQYDEQLTNIFDVQSQVAEDIALQLKRHLTPGDRQMFASKPGTSGRAYDLYLLGREYYRKYTAEDNEKAISLFYEALELDPDYAYALAGLGDAYAQKALHWSGDVSESLLDTAVLMSSRAVEKDPNLSEGYKALGLAFHYMGDLDAARMQYRRAIELDPYNDMALNNLSIMARKRGDFVEAARWAKKAFEINKSVPSSAVNMAEIYMEIGDDASAEKIVDHSLSVNPQAPDLLLVKGNLALRKDDLESAEAYAERLIDHPKYSFAARELLAEIQVASRNWQAAQEQFRQIAHAVAGIDSSKVVMVEAMMAFAEASEQPHSVERERWQEILKQVEELESKGTIARRMTSLIKAGVHGEMGDSVRAMEDMREASKHGWYNHQFISKSPYLRSVRDHETFDAYLQQLKILSDSVQTEVRKVAGEGT